MRLPSETEMASAGFAPEDYDEPDVEVWPENWPSWRLFEEMSGQWLHRGIGGDPVALNYVALYMRMDRLRLDDAAWERLYADVQCMEQAALKQMRIKS